MIGRLHFLADQTYVPFPDILFAKTVLSKNVFSQINLLVICLNNRHVMQIPIFRHIVC